MLHVLHIVGGMYNGVISVLIFSNFVKCFTKILKAARDGFGFYQCSFGTGKEKIVTNILFHNEKSNIATSILAPLLITAVELKMQSC